MNRAAEIEGKAMTIRRSSLLVFLVLCALYVAQGIHYYPQLPGTVASHFGPSGMPDGWSTRSSFIMMYFVLIGVLAVLFLGIGFGISKVPASLMNLSNKTYWLSKERRQGTLDFMFCYFLWFASATLLLVLDVSHQVLQVLIGNAHSLPHPSLSLHFYIGFTIIWCIGLFVRFGKKGKSQP